MTFFTGRLSWWTVVISTRIDLYPNPAGRVSGVSYQLSSVSDLRVTVLNEAGQVVLDRVVLGVQAGRMEMDLKGWADGVYLVTVLAGETRWVRKLVVGR